MTAAWPELPWRDWEPTVSTLHMWTQIVGKVRMALSPPLNHWWHITLYVTSRGLTTLAIPYGDRDFQVDFDFVEHRLRVSDSEAKLFTMPLEGDVGRALLPRLHGRLGRSWDQGAHLDQARRGRGGDPPFESDEKHASYDPHHANVLWRGFLAADRVMKEFQSGFVGKVSPVHLFWGSFDLAAARFSGRPAPLHSDAVVPNCRRG